MKNALAFKWFDLVLQVGCFAIPAIMHEAFIGWMVFGGAQIFSTLLNKVFLQQQYRALTRVGYEVFAIIFCVCGALCLATNGHGNENPLIYIVATSCAISPVLAIWYLGITIKEMINITETDEQ